MKKYIHKLKDRKSLIFMDQLLFRAENDNIVGVGTQLTYFLILSIFPFLIFFLNVLSYTPLGQEEVVSGMILFLPGDIQNLILSFISEISKSSSQGLLSLSALAGLWTASSGLKAVIKGINKAYDCKKSRSFIGGRLLSIAFTLALIFILILVFLTLIFGELIGNFIFDQLGINSIFYLLWRYLRLVIPILYMIILFILLYKYAPYTDERISFRSTLPGAFFASFAWIISSLSFSYYVNNFANYAVTYGSLVGIILMLIWLFFSSIIIIIGGEINATLDFFKKRGFKIHREKSILYEHIKKDLK